MYRLYSEPRPKSGYVVVIDFYNSPEVMSIPFASERAANREALIACQEALHPCVLGTRSVTMFRAPKGAET
jgi:hypothetical protein